MATHNNDEEQTRLFAEQLLGPDSGDSERDSSSSPSSSPSSHSFIGLTIITLFLTCFLHALLFHTSPLAEFVFFITALIWIGGVVAITN